MRLTKKDILAQRSRMTKTDYTIDLVCGCYVGRDRTKLLNFTKEFSGLKSELVTRYLEIVKKVLCSAMESNMLELQFQKNSWGAARQTILKKLTADGLKTAGLINAFYDAFIQSYKASGNYLLLVFHDVYPDGGFRAGADTEAAPVRPSAGEADYLIFAVCPVDRSVSALTCETEKNALELAEKSWIVGKPDLGFIYPPMAAGRRCTETVAYYVNTGRESHPEIMDRVLGCQIQQTALEERQRLQSIVSEAFDDAQTADHVFLLLQNELCLLAVEDEAKASEEDLAAADGEAKPDEAEVPAPVASDEDEDKAEDEDEGEQALPVLTPQRLEGCLKKIYMPEDAKQLIVRSYEREFGAAPPVTAKIADRYLIRRSLQQLKILQLEDQVRRLEETLAEMENEIRALKEP